MIIVLDILLWLGLVIGGALLLKQDKEYREERAGKRLTHPYNKSVLSFSPKRGAKEKRFMIKHQR